MVVCFKILFYDISLVIFDWGEVLLFLVELVFFGSIESFE